MADVKEVLEEVRELGQRLAEINTDLPIDEAIAELTQCDCHLEDLIEILVEDHNGLYSLTSWLRRELENDSRSHGEEE